MNYLIFTILFMKNLILYFAFWVFLVVDNQFAPLPHRSSHGKNDICLPYILSKQQQTRKWTMWKQTKCHLRKSFQLKTVFLSYIFNICRILAAFTFAFHENLGGYFLYGSFYCGASLYLFISFNLVRFSYKACKHF